MNVPSAALPKLGLQIRAGNCTVRGKGQEPQLHAGDGRLEATRPVGHVTNR